MKIGENSNNNKTRNFFVNLSVCMCTNSRLNGKFYSYQIWYGVTPGMLVKTLRRDFFENWPGFLKIQFLNDFFFISDFSTTIFLIDFIFSFIAHFWF